MTDEEYIGLAILEGQKCLKHDDVPCGAIIVKDGKIIARAHNEKVRKKLTTAHAEILAINRANKKEKCNRLDGSIIYITKEPCLMCMGAILSAKISKIVFGAYDPRFGTKDLASNNSFNHKCDIVGGVREEECKDMLTNFFSGLRKENGSTRKNTTKN